ncbi:hypothetical protein AALP_AA6G073300 [Arabis alpina]|uniref:Uncharacterized protein n=1 Tax=Arabis alpina TaxID=50452 RepID=A0A087GMN5_ARAAL|nr:hypothetical protein AALP_AA6G073300 [Arabis alpina]
MKEEEKITCPLETEDAKYFRVLWENSLQTKDSDGFDIEDDVPCFGMHYYDCEDPYPTYPFPNLLKLYAMLGLHRYHMLEGTRFDLHRLKKVNQEGCAASSYYIKLATNPNTDPQKQTFQVRVDEERLGKLDLICSIARPQGTPNEPFKPYISRGGLPDWLTDIALNDRNRFYMVKRQELLGTDWIYLYLQLVLCSHDRRLSLDDMSYLELVEAVIEPIEQVVPELPRLNAKSAIVYITYKDSRIDEPADRKAIVRRVIDEGYLSLRGELWT